MMRNISGVRGVGILLINDSTSLVGEDFGRGGAGAAVARDQPRPPPSARATNERPALPRTRYPRDTSRYTTRRSAPKTREYTSINPDKYHKPTVTAVGLTLLSSIPIALLRGRIITNKSTNKLEPYEGVASQKAQYNRVSV